MNKAKLEDVNMQPVGFRITRILNDYSRTLLIRHPQYYDTILQDQIFEFKLPLLYDYDTR